MAAYEELIASADDDYAHGRFKEAHIKYGTALAQGRARNHYCRQMRGVCSRHVAKERLRKAADAAADPELRREFLDQTARWLAKSEANLNSAFDESPEPERGNIRLEQAQTEELMARFMEMCGANPARRLSAARSYREEGFELLARA